jgi:hypothetical protein
MEGGYALAASCGSTPLITGWAGRVQVTVVP